MGAPQSKLQQPVENLYDAVAPSNKTAEVDLLLAARAERERMIKEEQELCRRKLLEDLKLPVEHDPNKEGLLGQPPAMTEEQLENARKRTEENLRETTQQQIERELFTSLLKEFISTDDDDAIVASLEDRLKKHMAKLEAAKALSQTISARFEKYTTNQTFGPFSSMTLEAMPAPGEMWDIMQKASKGSKIGSQMFTSFLHWMCVKTVAKILSEMKPDGLLPGLPPLPDDEFGNLVMPVGPGQDFKIPKKDIFELCVDMIDSVVVSLAPDLFRCIDTNNDGDMSKEEWEALVDVLAAPNPDKALDFIFTIMDKDSSKTIEVDEVASFFRKILKIILEVARSAVHIVGRLTIQCTQQMLADQIFDQMDKDKDGLLTADDIFMGFPPPLLQAVKTLPDFVKTLLAILEGDISEVEGDFSGLLTPVSSINSFKNNFSEQIPADMRTRLSRFIVFAKEIGNSILSWKGGLDKDFFFTKIKAYAMGLFKQAFEALQTLIVADSECAAMVQMKLFSNCIDELNAGMFDRELRQYSDSIFDLIDVDGDGKISTTEIKTWTDLVFGPCAGEATAKSRLVAIFNALDLNKNGKLSKAELVVFIGKGLNIYLSIALLWLELMGHMVIKSAELQLDKVLDTFDSWIKDAGEQERQMVLRMVPGADFNGKMDRKKFELMLKTLPFWMQLYFKKEFEPAARHAAGVLGVWVPPSVRDEVECSGDAVTSKPA